MSRASRAAAWSLTALFLGAADCSSSEQDLSRFNQEDSFDVSIGQEILPVADVVLFSSTGSVEVGSATLDPGGGPVGTLHTLQVWVDADYADQVDAASVQVDSGERGTRTLDLVPDSADERLYWLELQSVGEEGEVRTDTFTIQLWDALDEDDESSSSDEE
ncbi:MAG: hypothetical protein VX899_02680 [Myxococcota bacterium]|nr:hypothetical protein [Myxococcota bacterium]